MSAIYLDSNATTRPAPQVIAAMTACMEQDWGNPSSPHRYGQAAKRRLAEARAAVAALLGAQPVEVIFTSGATEANQMVLDGAVARSAQAPQLVLSAVEHAAQLKAARRWAQSGRARVDLLAVDSNGRVDVAAARRLIQPGTALVSVMAANNETGVLQPIDEIAALAKTVGAPFHVDATQVAGKQSFDFARSGADLVSVSAHKLHGPKGIGALLLRKGLACRHCWPVRRSAVVAVGPRTCRALSVSALPRRSPAPVCAAIWRASAPCIPHSKPACARACRYGSSAIASPACPTPPVCGSPSSKRILC